MEYLNEKICLVTGASSGIGKATAMRLAELGAIVILVIRNHTRGERTLNEIIKVTENKNVYLFITDLSSQTDIQNLAKTIKKNFDRIDVLINNAGAYFSKRHITVDGIEATFAVNYLSRFLLTNLLLDLILNSKQGRIIDISGEYHRKGKINFEDLEFTKKYSGLETTKQAKLAEILFSYELARRLVNTNVTVNSIHPGAVATNIIYNDPDAHLAKKFAYRIFSIFLKNPFKAAENIIYLASSPEFNDGTGKYFIDKNEVLSAALTYDEDLAQKLWKVSEEMTNVKINEKEHKPKLNYKTE